LLKKFAHSRNLLIEFARSIKKLLTMKNLAGSDGSTRWLNVCASSQSEHRWRAPLNGLSRNGWNVLAGPSRAVNHDTDWRTNVL
jgi:hypothetical protein